MPSNGAREASYQYSGITENKPWFQATCICGDTGAGGLVASLYRVQQTSVS